VIIFSFFFIEKPKKQKQKQKTKQSLWVAGVAQEPRSLRRRILEELEEV
jgi:GH25 family lysozyme M1 (1,4-beta-N-acetylmuramidase)